MRKALLSLRVVSAVFVFNFTFSITSCTNPDSSTRTSSVHMASFARIIIPKAQGLFEPYILTVRPGTIVTWQNNDPVAHIFTTTPERSNFLNTQSFSLKVTAHASVRFTFTHPGLYHYYEKTMGTWNTRFSRIAANKGSPHFPLAMEGVIWVQGPINSLPTASINYIPNGHDDFAIEFLAIKQLGAITWHNFDGDAHFLASVPGWSTPINPLDIGVYRILGTDDAPGGDSATIFFSKPGLYYYYCRNHDKVNLTTHRVQALMMASEYPIAMEGFVLVTNG